MRRLALSLAACGLLAGVAGPAASSTTDTQRLVIRLISDNSLVKTVDKPPKGKLNAGDQLTTTSTLRNQVAQFGKPKGALVGHDRATSTFISSKAYTIDGYASLPGGRVMFHGRVTRPSSTVPVTGGTGRFAHARGTVAAEDLGGSRSINIYRLTLP